MSLLIRNGRIVTAKKEFEADVFVEGETIREVGPSLKANADTVIDATDKLVIPGGIDPHTHMDMPLGDTVTSDNFETGTIAAACGGTTTILDYAGQTRGHSLMEGLEEWRRKASKRAVIDYGFHMMLCDLPDRRLPEMTALVKEGVSSFKVFMAYPGRLMLDDGAILRALGRAKEDGALVCVHAETGPLIEDLVGQALRDRKTSPKYHAQTRPPHAEAEAVRRAANLAWVASASLYVVHVSCAEALAEVKRARERGVKIFAETCPQYLFLDESLYDQKRDEAAKYVISPPLRRKSNQKALWNGLNTGDLQCVGTDHCPFWLKDKGQGSKEDFTKIPGGGPGVENRMSLLYQGVVEGKFSASRFVEITSTAAAKIFGLYPKKGTIAVGSDADLVVFDPKRTETIGVKNPRMHHMRVDYSFYEGVKVQGAADLVISRGAIVARDGQFVGKKGAGEFLKRTPLTQ